MAERKITSNIKERQNNWVLIGGIGSIVTGLMFLGASPLIGLLIIAAGVVALAVSNMGTNWNNLEPSKKVWVVPGVVCGVVAVVAVIAVMAIFASAAGSASKDG